MENKIILEKDVDEYNYALKILFLKLIHYVVIFSIAFFLDILIETIVFLYSYSIIRTYIGGIHANNPLVCLSISILFVITLKQILNININYFLILIFMIIVSCYWYTNCNKFLSKVKFLIHLLFINIILLIFYILTQDTYINCIVYGYILNIILFTIKNRISLNKIFS
ncbi:accessory gene regulator B family protein [Thomasclavelia cocleata]|uniref:accessory gene regulator B family protein n=1 Tax=Thomasclavelia cocleata TaxID=69824 RepID=UPI003C700C47